jgi:hypothetical protein
MLTPEHRPAFDDVARHVRDHPRRIPGPGRDPLRSRKLFVSDAELPRVLDRSHQLLQQAVEQQRTGVGCYKTFFRCQ